SGYHVEVDEMDRFGQKKKMRKWIPGNAHAALKWLRYRRPDVYRGKAILSVDDAFLRFLDQMDEQAKMEKERNERVIPQQRTLDARAIQADHMRSTLM